MELPSISSTTSISENPDLANYYEKLLFKNSSGKSLTDLPAKLRANKEASDNRGSLNRLGSEKGSLDNFDFINGFKNSLNISNNDYNNVNNSNTDRRGLGEPDYFNAFQGNNSNQLLTPPQTSKGIPTSNPSEFALFWGKRGVTQGNGNTNNGLGTYVNDIRQQIGADRRSSYISDNLIDGHLIQNDWNNRNHMFPQGSSSIVNYSLLQPAQQNLNYMLSSDLNESVNDQGNLNWQGRRNTQPALNSTYSIRNDISIGGHPNYVDQNSIAESAPHVTSRIPVDNIPQNEPLRAINESNFNNNTHSDLSVNNGLLFVNGKQISSTPELHTLYSNCGLNYFSSDAVYKFTDHLNVLLDRNRPGDNVNPEKKTIVSKFVDFLKSCNLNFGYQSMNDDIDANKSRFMASNSVQDKPLVLVALKNGKLELLSTPQNTSLLMKRGDLVIIDGDRGKDLVLVVEPYVSLDFALLINFLKKKVHFDSLITCKSQHYPTERFIESLIQSKQGNGDKLNSKLYDVIELTQLIIPSKQILRFATPWEVTTNLHSKFEDELKALHIAQTKLKHLNEKLTSNPNRKQLNIKILNAEFQFDRKKLTFYYVCEERNDFRELIKELFKFYKTRIWLCAIPNNLDIDAKYYDTYHKELNIYDEMIRKSDAVSVEDTQNAKNGGSEKALVAPPLNEIELDNFQIGVYQELVNQLF